MRIQIYILVENPKNFNFEYYKICSYIHSELPRAAFNRDVSASQKNMTKTLITSERIKKCYFYAS